MLDLVTFLQPYQLAFQETYRLLNIALPSQDLCFFFAFFSLFSSLLTSQFIGYIFLSACAVTFSYFGHFNRSCLLALSLTVKAHVKRAMRKAHFKLNRAFKVIQGHPYWCPQKSRTVCRRTVLLMPTSFLKLTKI